jgi:hypothetical protein
VQAVRENICLRFRPSTTAAQAEPRIDVAPFQHYGAGDCWRIRSRFDVTAEASVDSVVNFEILLRAMALQQMSLKQSGEVQGFKPASQEVNYAFAAPSSGIYYGKSLIERHGIGPQNVDSQVCGGCRTLWP